MHETIKFYDGTLHAIGQLALITPNVLIKMAVFVDFALFFKNDRRSVAVRYARDVGVEISDKYGLPSVFGNKRIFGKISYFFLN
jgi:hypothetical protein